jgi:hypothetical protein
LDDKVISKQLIGKDLEGRSCGLIFKVISQHSPGGAEKNHKKLQ